MRKQETLWEVEKNKALKSREMHSDKDENDLLQLEEAS